jgi:hypothetical protein
MSIKLFYLGFDIVWPEFLNSNLFEKLLGPSDQVVSTLEDSNVVIIGCSLQFYEFNSLLSYKGLRIIYMTEPIFNSDNFLFTRLAYESKMYDYLFGCVNNDIVNYKYKYPLYMNSFETEIDIKLPEQDLKTIDGKKYCCLISRHDFGKIRIPIYDIMKNYGPIECPSILLNNCSNEYLNEVGNVKYISDFVFNICCENFEFSYNGYITEKLMNCCLAGAIPIYIGSLDEIDKKIFNTERIITVDFKNPLHFIYKLTILVTNKEIIERFYNQKIFLDTAIETLKDLKENPKRLLEAIRKQLK